MQQRVPCESARQLLDVVLRHDVNRAADTALCSGNSDCTHASSAGDLNNFRNKQQIEQRLMESVSIEHDDGNELRPARNAQRSRTRDDSTKRKRERRGVGHLEEKKRRSGEEVDRAGRGDREEAADPSCGDVRTLDLRAGPRDVEALRIAPLQADAIDVELR